MALNELLKNTFINKIQTSPTSMVLTGGLDSENVATQYDEIDSQEASSIEVGQWENFTLLFLSEILSRFL